MAETYFSVAVDAPLFQTFTYASAIPIELGSLVSVSFGKRNSTGVILSQTSTPHDTSKIKTISNIIEEYPPLPTPYLNWVQWVSDYYIYPVGQTLKLCYPPLKKEGRGARKKPIELSAQLTEKPTLTDEQTLATQAILNSEGFSAHLLYGITGSGKTEVYLEVLENLMAQGKRGLVLVPEISLTPQLIRRFSERFGEEIAVIHSHLTDREKTTQWWSIVEGKKKILIGARSALFCPIPNLGAIIIDEEHEASFKQDEKLKYHARDCAIMLAQELKIPICMGSATPSLESWKNVAEGKYQIHKLTKRVTSDSLASIKVIDMREMPKESPLGLPPWLSDELYLKIQEKLNAREQVALFLNRRGLSQVVMCRECGYVHICPNCDVSLSLHAKSHLTCHYCGYHEDLLQTCKSCKTGEPKAIGIGTEKIEEEMKHLFPQARVLRMDRDEINDRHTLEESIRKIEDFEIDIIIGTQMIAKGLDFKKLTLVGIILADIGFNIPDFRTSERNFQLLTQVSGRAGRHQAGEVLIQTYNPEYPSLIYSEQKNFEGFAEAELSHRKELFYPPYGKLMSVRLQSLNVDKLNDYVGDIHRAVSKHAFGNQFQVLGPIPSPVFKLKNKFRYGMLIKGSGSKQIRDFYKKLIEILPPPSGVQIQADVDPLHTF